MKTQNRSSHNILVVKIMVEIVKIDLIFSMILISYQINWSSEVWQNPTNQYFVPKTLVPVWLNPANQKIP